MVGSPYGGVKEQGPCVYANKLAQRGFIVLTFDPVYMGESGGEPRHVSSPDIFTENFSAGVDFLGLQKNVDRKKLRLSVYMEDGSAAEIYRLYEYSPKEGAESSAEFYLGIASELDCDMSEDNIRKAWEKQHGNAEFFGIKAAEHDIFKFRAEMRNKSVHRISYLLHINESELLDCTMELHKPNSRKKLDEKLSGMFEEFARQCKLKA